MEEAYRNVAGIVKRNFGEGIIMFNSGVFPTLACLYSVSWSQLHSFSTSLKVFTPTLLPGAPAGNGTPLQYACLENPMGGGAWWAAVHGVARSRTRLSDFTVTFPFQELEMDMATHSSVLAWRIPGTGKPGGLPSMGSHRVGHN